jgi:beta-fructofuranosidase
MRLARILSAAGALVLGLIGAAKGAEEQPWPQADDSPSGKESALPAPLAGLPAPVADYRKVVRSTDVETYSRAALALRQWMIENDSHRPIYHFTGPESWINDPNGPIYHGGKYHLFYQFDPIVDGQRSKRCWGHAVSEDLVHWTDWPVAVWPDSPYDRGGVYSGNVFIDNDGFPCALYTGNVAGHGETYGMLARSTDGWITWQKKKVMDNSQRPHEYSPVHWDGYVWRDGDQWCQLIGGATGGADRQGAAWLWTSKDLEHWTLQKNIAPSIKRGKFWELPYLIPLGPKHVLLVGAGNPYWVGRYDRHTMIFTPDDPEPKSMDNGTYYSFNVNMVDDKGPGGSRRQLMHGWVTGPATPTKSVPYWEGAHSIPRVLTLRGRHVAQEPIPEIESLRGEHRRWGGLEVQPGRSGYLPDVTGDALEIIAVFAPGGVSPGTSASDVASRFGVKLRVSGDGKDCVRVWYDPKTDQFGTDGVVVKKASAWGGITRHGSQDEPVVLRIFLDRSVLEVYCGGAALTNRTFADAKALGVDLFAEGGTARLQSLDVWKVNPLWKP